MNSLQLIFRPILALLSLIYAYVMHIRGLLYRAGFLFSESSGAFVVSIGNIQAGGTGKTPVVAFFARRWRPSVRLGIVSRGYGRRTKGSLRVETESIPNDERSLSERFGDEPTWLATALSDGTGQNVPVQVGEKRVVAAQDLIASEGVKLILLDDGFQHLTLRRSYDIVLLDVSVPSWHWHVLPWGRLREPISALRRADLIVLSKTESALPGTIEKFEAIISNLSAAGPKIPVVRFEQRLSWPTPQVNEKLILAAGLANNQSFFRSVVSHVSKPQVIATREFRDHHEYSHDDVRALKSLARENGVRRVLVTEKDAIKIGPLWHVQKPVGPASLDEIELAISNLEVRPARESDEKQLERVDEHILNQVRGSSRTRAGVSDREPPA